MIHASIIEVVWLIVAVFAWTVAAFNFTSARGDMLHFASSSMPVQVFMTRRIYWSSVLYLAMATVVVVASVWDVIHPPPPPPIWDLPQSWMNICAWIAMSVLLSTHAFLSMRWRRALALGDYGNGGRRRGDQVGIPPSDAVNIALAKKAEAMENKLERIDETTTETKETVKRVDEKLSSNPDGLGHD